MAIFAPIVGWLIQVAGPGNEPSDNWREDGHGIKFLLREDGVSFGSGLRHQNAVRLWSLKKFIRAASGLLRFQAPERLYGSSLGAQQCRQHICSTFAICDIGCCR